MIGEDINVLPEFTTENVLQYFIYRKKNDGLERQDWKNFNSGRFKLFKDGHIQKVYVSDFTTNVYVKATCLPEMNKDRTYSLFITIRKSSVNVSSANCSCPAGKGPHGSGKHLAALCFAIEDFVKTCNIALEQGEEVCMSVLQKWNQPRKRRLEHITLSSLPYGKTANSRFHYKSYIPRPLKMRKTSKIDLEVFSQQLKDLPTSCGFLHLLSQPASQVDKPKYLLPLTPRSIQARVHHEDFQGSLPPTLETIQKLGEEFVTALKRTADEKTAIEEKTPLQGNAVRWHEERFCRLTASNFGNVVLRRSGFDKLAQDILFTKVSSVVPSIKWGHDHEPIAFQKYEKWLSDHSNLKLKKSSILIGEQPYLGASPDGVLEDAEGNLSGIVEIKCPYSAANLTVKEAC